MTDESLFVDWLTVWQVHPEHPPLNSGAIVTFDKSGRITFERMRSARVVGSHSTSCSFKSDGQSVLASGNFGRFNRTDNLFGFDPREVLQKTNDVTTRVELPAFWVLPATDSRNGFTPRIVFDSYAPLECEVGDSPGEGVLHLSRIDLTRNYSTGGISNARALIRDISRKNATRAKRGIAGDESVWFTNTRYMLKFYVKALEMAAHGDTESKAYEFALQHGIVRAELELKRRHLADIGWHEYGQFLRAWDMGTVHQLFDEYTKPFMESKGVASPSVFIDSLPQRLRVVVSAFLSGQDVRAMMSRRTFYRYRKQLLDYGLDIADDAPAQVTTIIREVEIKPLTAPEWYWEKRVA